MLRIEHEVSLKAGRKVETIRVLVTTKVDEMVIPFRLTGIKLP